jgi:hypothetical protein
VAITKKERINKTMNKYKTYLADGYWEDDTNKDILSVLLSDNSWDGIEDEEDRKIFYYTDGKPVKIGDVISDGFVITNIDKGGKQ